MDTAANYSGKEIYIPDAVASVAWSPEGTTIAYVQQPASPDYFRAMPERRIWLTDPDGNNRRRLTKDESREERPQWSADGRYILYVRMAPSQSATPGADVVGASPSLRLHELATGNEVIVLDVLEYQSDDISTNVYYYGHVEWDRILDWHRGNNR